MPTQLRPPADHRSNWNGNAFAFADGRPFQPGGDGWWELDDQHAHELSGLLARGWRTREDIEEEAKRDQREAELRKQDPAGYDARAENLSLSDVLQLAKTEGFSLKTLDGKIQFAGLGDPTKRLATHVRIRREELVQLIGRRDTWRDFE